MKIAILGGGFLGQTLKKEHPEWDLIRSSELLEDQLLTINGQGVLNKFDVIINTIAETDTRRCESKEARIVQQCFRLNSLLPLNLSEYCKKTQKKLIHISTACLYAENTIGEVDEYSYLSPKTAYSLQKYYGEKTLNPNDLIIRGRLFFGQYNFKSNLITKIKKFKTLSDDYNSFTSVHSISRILPLLLDKNAKGAYNVVAEQSSSLYQLLTENGITDIMKYVPSVNEYQAPNLIVRNTRLKELGIVVENLNEEFSRCFKNYE
jgi:dTDP-4-dehydrorhamnose reductase